MMEDLELFKSFRFNLYNYAPGKHSDNSSGVEYHFIGYMYTGTARIVSDKGTLELQKGDLFYIPKGCRYHSYWYGGAQFDSFAFSAIPQKTHTAYCLQKLTITDEIKQLHRQLAEDRTVNARSVGALYRLLWALMPSMKCHIYEKGGMLARQIADHIYENPNLSTKQVAQSCGISESTAYHVLRKELNKTPNQLRQEAKCQQAVRLLSCTALPVEEISTQLGFSSSSYMRKLLRATTGKTPLQLRKAAQFI